MAIFSKNVCLNVSGDVEINYEKGTITNTLYNTKPLVLHGNGPSKIDLYNFGNYLAKSWNSVKGCLTCKEDNIYLEKVRIYWNLYLFFLISELCIFRFPLL